MTPVPILHVWNKLLHNSPYGAVVCGSNISILTIAELSLISHSAPTLPSKEGQEVDGGTQQEQLIWIGQGDILCHAASNTVMKVVVEEEKGRGASFKFVVAQRIPELWSACGIWWIIAFALLGSIFVWFFFFFTSSFIKLSFNSQVFLLFSSCSLPHHAGKGTRAWVCSQMGAYLLARVDPPQLEVKLWNPQKKKNKSLCSSCPSIWRSFPSPCSQWP